jgi:hypothetical protein
VSIAALFFAVLGLVVAVLPAAGAVGLGFGPFVSLLGGGISVAGLVFGVAAMLFRSRAARRDQAPSKASGRLLGAALLLGVIGVVASLVIERRQLAREAAADAAAAARSRDPGAARRDQAADDLFDQQLKENLNK